MKKIITVIAAVLMLAGTLAACGKDKEKQATPDSAAKETVAATTAETVKVAETTAEGGVTFKNGEGNTVTTDKNGDITSVKDKNGEVIEITEYITTHHYTITNEGDSGDNSAPAEKDQESDSKGSSSKAESKAEDKSASSAAEKDEEPTSREVIIPDGQDEYELPII